MLEHSITVKHAEFGQDGRFLIVACAAPGLEAGHAVIWDLAARRRIGPALKHQSDGVVYAALNHDGNRAVTAGEDKVAWVWDPSTGEPITPPLIHKGQVLSAVFSPDDRWVATSSVNGAVRVWEADTGKPVFSG